MSQAQVKFGTGGELMHRSVGFCKTVLAGLVTGLVLGRIGIMRARTTPEQYMLPYLEQHLMTISAALGVAAGVAFWVVRPLRRRSGSWRILSWLIVAAASFGVLGVIAFIKDPRPIVAGAYTFLTLSVGLGFGWFDYFIHSGRPD